MYAIVEFIIFLMIVCLAMAVCSFNSWLGLSLSIVSAIPLYLGIKILLEERKR
jgi:hypothetical protein